MSLEKENYHFIRTLPLSFKQFTIQNLKSLHLYNSYFQLFYTSP